MTFGSLFAGIGGIDLGLERAGMQCLWQVEKDEYCQRVLAKHWPEVKRYGDITTIEPRELEPVDLIAGGFPCQDISYAGRGAGLDGARSGLFFEVIRLVRQCKPRFVLLENVAALLVRGMDRVCGELAQIGYDAEWHCLPAAAFGAPHIRDRVFILAYPCCERSGDVGNAIGGQGRKPTGTLQSTTLRCGDRAIMPEGIDSVCPVMADAGREHRQSGDIRQPVRDETTIGASQTKDLERCSESINDVSDAESRGWKAYRLPIIGNGRQTIEQFRFLFGRTQWEFEPAVRRVAHGIPNRVHRLRGLGNAVVPQVAEWIGRQLMESEANR